MPQKTKQLVAILAIFIFMTKKIEELKRVLYTRYPIIFKD